MGLFSGKKKTYRTSTATRMIEDKDIRPASRMAVYSYVNSNDSASNKVSTRGLVDYINEATANSAIPKLRAAHRMSKRDDYAYGELTSTYTFEGGADVASFVREAMEINTGATITIEYASFTEPNFLHFAWQNLFDNYGYNPETNEVTAQSVIKGTPVYLKDIVLTLSQTTMDTCATTQLEPLGSAPTCGYTPTRQKATRNFTAANVIPGDADPIATFIFETATGTYTDVMGFSNYVSANVVTTGIDSDNSVNQGAEIIAPTIPDDLLDTDYVIARYTENGVPKYLTYRYGSKTNPLLEGLFKTNKRLGSYIPRVYARLKGKKCNHNDFKDTDKFKSMKKLCKKLGFDWNEWVDNLHANMDNLGDVREIYMTYSLAVNDTDPAVMQYMYHYFLGIYKSAPNNFLGVPSSKRLASKLLFNKESFALHSALTSDRTYKAGINVTLSDNSITSGFNCQGISYNLRSGTIGPVGSYKTTVSGIRHTFCYQVNETTYSEVAVLKLTSFTIMDGKRLSDDGSSSELIVPLDIGIKANLQVLQRERLYAKSMHVIVNTSKTVKQKWYQTGIFKVIMFIIAVVVSVFYPPAGVAMYSWMAVAYGVLVGVAVNLVITIAFKLLVALGVSGEIIAAIAVVVAVVAAAYGGYGALSQVAGKVAISATNVLRIINAAFEMASKGLAYQLQTMYREYQKAMGDFSEKSKALEARAEELGVHRYGDASTFIFEQPNVLSIRIGEDPEDYFQRSIHELNGGTLVFNMQESFVEDSLRLPNLQALLIKLENLKDGISR